MTVFQMYSGRKTLFSTKFRSETLFANVDIDETDKFGFALSDFDDGCDYKIYIGDIVLSRDVSPRQFQNVIQWPVSQCFDGASGVTTISLRDEFTNSTLVSFKVIVQPTKLSAAAYERMAADLGGICTELLLDILSKSRTSIGHINLFNQSGIRPFTARLEFNLIQQFWRSFSSVLSSIFDEPNSCIHVSPTVRRLHQSDRIDGNVLRQLVVRGSLPFDDDNRRPLLTLPTPQISYNTPENRTLSAFLQLLLRRTERCLARITDERNTRILHLNSYKLSERPVRRHFTYRERPKIERLQERIESAEALIDQMTRAIDGSLVSKERMSLREIYRNLESSVFRGDARYALAAQSIYKYLMNAAIVLEVGEDDVAKSNDKIFEQWVFFQLCEAFRSVGLTCISHQSVFIPITTYRYSVDIDRNAAVVFEANDGLQVRLLYEPTILPLKAARREDLIFRGNEPTPFTPDIVIEILETRMDQDGMKLVYAAVVDAKYSRSAYMSERLEGIEKYSEIRSVETKNQIVRQLWVAAPIKPSLQLRDDTIIWPRDGEVSAHYNDVIRGIIGIDPGNPKASMKCLRRYVLGVLNHARKFSEAFYFNDQPQ